MSFHFEVLLREARTRAGLSQRDLAHRAGTAQSVVARVEKGQASPTIETVERLLAAAGFDLHLELHPRRATDSVVDAYKRDIDRSLLRENLQKSPAERIATLQSLLQLATEARRAGRAVRRTRKR